MEPDIAPTVTIERRFFETLIRRGQIQPSDVPISRSFPNDALLVFQADHEALQRTARRYANLRQNLLRGGVVEDTINLLSQDDSTNSIQDNEFGSPPQSIPYRDHRSFSTCDDNAPPYMISRQSQMGAGRKPLVEFGDRCNEPLADRVPVPSDWADFTGVSDRLPYSVDNSPDEAVVHDQQLYPAPTETPAYAKHCMRTMQLLNLPNGTTHADITCVVRGGLLLDVSVRAHDRSATVSFLHSADANAFFNHCRRHDLYIRHRRIELRWSDRQFTLPGHVANKIGLGATRNLILRRCGADTTEASIREDLDHIHNLAIVKITFIGDSCFISLNSVHNCVVAKSCMMSRLKYKSCRFEWDVDECAQPLLDRAHAMNVKKDLPLSNRNMNAVANRFNLLSLDEENEDYSDTNYTATKGSLGISA